MSLLTANPTTTSDISFKVADRIQQVLTPQGKVVGALPNLSHDELVGLYRWMLLGRIWSERMVALQRQGRMGTFAPSKGQEATLVGMAMPLEPEDWLITSYRENLSQFIKGIPLLAPMKQWGGYISDDYPYEARCLPFQVVLGTQMLHAVGIAQAIKYNNEPQVVVAACGDGATSEGDFNEALNFAGAFKAPVVFIVQNNGWAISTPRKQQTAAEYIADRGAGFGLPSCVVDGNDVLAVYQVVSEAIAQARAGDGPTLIEAITYRMGAHTTADDPTKYRAEAELKAWSKRDPINRFRHFLIEWNILTQDRDRSLHEEIEAEINQAVEDYEALPSPDPRQQFEHVYAQKTPQFQRQQDNILRDLEFA